MTTQKTVEVRLAFAFTCEDCGGETFVSSVMHEFSAEEQSDLAEELGERPQTGKWITHPEHVTCSHCQTEFRAINPGEEIDHEGMAQKE